MIFGIATISAFYALFFLIGAFGARNRGQKPVASELLLAGRRLPLWLAIATLVSTWVGGGYINGTAEAVYDSARGLVWAQAPWCYGLSLIIGGLVFAGTMRRLRYTTLLDLFDQRYGRRTAALLYLPALLGELFWMAAILAALGAAFSTILGLPPTTAIVVSALIAVVYTMVGGLWSVAYTDALQFLCIAGGTCLALPFALSHAGGWDTALTFYREHYGEAANVLPSLSAFRGPQPWAWQWADIGLLLVLGGIPWQVYFQRVFACRSDRAARRLSVIAGVGCFLMAIPAGLLGMAGAAADWSATAAGPPPDAAMVLPYVLRYLTPVWVATVGLCAVAAAVMSSVDSSILSASSMFAWNIYRPWKPGCSERELMIVMRTMIVVVGGVGAALAISVNSVYTLWYLSADLVFVVLFPQLVMGLYYRRASRIGALAGAVVGLVLRFGGGEPTLGIPALIPYPMQAPDGTIYFPFRTFSMLSSLLTIWWVSRWFDPAPVPHTVESTSGA